ncbi:MAG: hypothetical protein L0215_26830 [Gemmataceae bacterium]|nr:hypothetical protein [Gemmataceae bacterium]
MSTDPKLVPALPEAVNVLPELTFDMLAGQRNPEALGKTHTPVNVLQSMTLDVLSERGRPVLQLMIAFRPEATAAQIGRDYHRLYVLLNEYDLAQGGSGLRPIENASEGISGNDEVQLEFWPIDPSNAAQRFETMIGTIESVTSEFESIRACKIRVAA